MKRYKRLAVALCIVVAATHSSAAEESPYADKLLGDMGGERSKFAERGIEPSLDYNAEMWVNRGGIKDNEGYIGVATLGVALDGEKLLGIKGNSMNFSMFSTHGAHVNGSSTGSVQGISNLEVAENGLRLFEAWVNQEFLDGRLAVLVGLHDLNSEFSTTPMSDNFVKPVMQIGQSLAQSGRNGPSIYPASSLAARLRYQPTEQSYVAVAVYDGVPADTDHPRSNPINLDDKDGLLLIGEAGLASADEADKIALGVWDYTGRLDDLVDLDGFGDPAKSLAQGAYLVSSYRFYHDTKTERSLGAVLRAGLADGDTAQTDWDYTLGLVANGWMPSRPESEIGLGLAQAHNSDDYMTANAGSDRNEYSYELYYRDTVYNGISIQPDLQYVVNPGTDPALKNATLVGLRVDVSL